MRQGQLFRRATSGRVVWAAAFATVSGVGAMTARADTFTYVGGNYTQNFDHLQATAQTYSFAGNGPFNPPDDGNPAALTGWQYGKVGGSGTNSIFRIDNGASNSGASSQAADRAGDVCFEILVLRLELHTRQPQRGDEDASQHRQHECSDRNVIGPCLHQLTFSVASAARPRTPAKYS